MVDTLILLVEAALPKLLPIGSMVAIELNHDAYKG